MTKALHAPPRWVRWALAVLGVLIGCAVWGVTTASVRLSLGPHEATYAVSTDGQITVDVGPLGTLELDSPAPANLGVDVVVGEIPDDLTAIGQAQTLEALSGDLNSYLQFFAGPEQTVRAVVEALAVDAARRAAAAFGVVAVVVAGVALLLGAARRREVSTWLAEHTWGCTAAVAVVCVVGAGLASGEPESAPGAEPASPVFAGTPLEGARITGRLAGVVNTYGMQLIGLYEDNLDFYERADDNLVRAFSARAAQDTLMAASGPTPNPSGGPPTGPSGSPSEVPAPEETPVPDRSPAGDGSPAGGGASGGEAAPGVDAGSGVDGASAGDGAPSPTPSPSAAEEDLVTVLLVSDLHCNTGMTPLIATAVRRSGADVVLNAGDTTMNGTAVESFCVSSFASAVPGNIPLVVADGNHDSTETSAQERKEGERVLDGKVVDVKGIRILGDRDALETRVGQGSRAAQAESAAQQGARLAETACDADDGVDLLLIHTPWVGVAALNSGCVPVQFSGHTHERSGPEPAGNGVRYVAASTAGAATGQPTVGPLHGTAEMTVLRFDPVARRFVDWQLVRVRPDTTAVVGERKAFPAPEPGSDEPESDEPASDDTSPAAPSSASK